MPAASDIILYGPASRVDDDTSSTGGAIDTAARPLDTQIGSAVNLEVVSDGADTRNVTFVGRIADGSVNSETVALNGTTAVAIPNGPYQRILSVTAASGSASRTVLLRQASAGTTYHTLNVNETEGYCLFRSLTAEASGGSDVVAYEVVYHKNTHGSEALLSAVVRATVDADALFTTAVAASQGDVGTLTNRLTAPVGPTFVGESTDQAIPGTDLAASAYVASYIKCTLPAGTAGGESSYTLEMEGSSA